MSDKNYRLYAFVANHYLSPLQCGLQTAHVVGSMAVEYKNHGGPLSKGGEAFFDWAESDKTIIICGAGNHKGVLDCFTELRRTAFSALSLPVSLFNEDEQSMNGMATACGVIVPQQYWDTKLIPPSYENASAAAMNPHWEYINEAGVKTWYSEDCADGQFVKHIKSFRLA
jgi:hypothetical protein